MAGDDIVKDGATSTTQATAKACLDQCDAGGWDCKAAVYSPSDKLCWTKSNSVRNGAAASIRPGLRNYYEWVTNVKYRDCKYALDASASKPVPTTLAWSSNTAKAKALDVTKSWTNSGDTGCGVISACILKAEGCAAPYTGTAVAVVNKFEIHGQQNVEAGYSEKVCVQCIDDWADALPPITSLTFTQTE